LPSSSAAGITATYVQIVDSVKHSTNQYEVIVKYTLTHTSATNGSSLSYLKSMLTNAVSNGQFSSSLQSIASSNNATALVSATIIAVQYDTYSSLNPTDGSSSSSSSSDGGLSTTNSIIIGVVVGGVGLLIIFAILYYQCVYLKKEKHVPSSHYDGLITSSPVDVADVSAVVANMEEVQQQQANREEEEQV